MSAPAATEAATATEEIILPSFSNEAQWTYIRSLAASNNKKALKMLERRRIIEAQQQLVNPASQTDTALNQADIDRIQLQRGHQPAGTY